MSSCLAGLEAYGMNGVYIGRMCDDGCVRKGDVVIFRVVKGSVYSMHDQYLGRYIDGVCKSWNGTLIFATRDEEA